MTKVDLTKYLDNVLRFDYSFDENPTNTVHGEAAPAKG